MPGPDVIKYIAWLKKTKIQLRISTENSNIFKWVVEDLQKLSRISRPEKYSYQIKIRLDTNHWTGQLVKTKHST